MASSKTTTKKTKPEIKIQVQAKASPAQAKGEVNLEISVPKKLVDDIYQETLQHLAKQAEIKGFRKGQAPLKLVEEKLGTTYIWRQASQSIITIAYLQAVQATQIKPIADPKLVKAVTEPNSDWQLSFRVPVVPEVKLPDDYLYQIAKQVKNKTEIITPDQAAKQTKDQKQADVNKKLADIFQALLKVGQVELAPSLVEAEVNRRLASIFDQLQKVGMTIDDYAKSKGLTPQQLRDQTAHQIEEELKLEFLLAKIAKREKIKVDEAQVDKVLAQSGKGQSTGPQDKIYVRSILEKQQVINFLLKAVDKQEVVIVP